MKKYVLFLTIIIVFTLTACGSKVERMEEKNQVETTEKTSSDKNKEDGIFPDDVFDEEDSNKQSQQEKADSNEDLTDEDFIDSFNDITGNTGPIILPDDEF